jgi:hypothetical protein
MYANKGFARAQMSSWREQSQKKVKNPVKDWFWSAMQVCECLEWEEADDGCARNLLLHGLEPTQ